MFVNVRQFSSIFAKLRRRRRVGIRCGGAAAGGAMGQIPRRIWDTVMITGEEFDRIIYSITLQCGPAQKLIM